MDIGGTVFSPLAKTFRQECQNCILCVQGNKIRKYFFLFSWNRSKNFNNSVTGQKTFKLLSKRFPPGCRNCFLFDIGQSWRNFCFFDVFWTLTVKFRAFWQTKSGRVVRTAFYVSMETKWGNIYIFFLEIILKKLIVQSLGKKRSSFCQNNLRWVVETVFSLP